MVITFLTLLGMGVIIAAIFLIKQDTDNNQNLEEGDFFTCGMNGCKPNKTGEHRTYSSCLKACRSYVNEKGKCRQVEGVPWDSFSDLKACYRDTT